VQLRKTCFPPSLCTVNCRGKNKDAGLSRRHRRIALWGTMEIRCPAQKPVVPENRSCSRQTCPISSMRGAGRGRERISFLPPQVATFAFTNERMPAET